MKKIILILILLILPIVSAELEGFGNQPQAVEQVAGRFELNKAVIKNLFSEEAGKAQISITNLENYESSYPLELQGFRNKAYLSTEHIQIPGRESRSLEIIFEKATPGIYTGKLIVQSRDQIEIIPIVSEVESTDVIIDGKLSLLNDEFKAGDEITFSVTLMDLSNNGVHEIRVHEYIYDLSGNEIREVYEDRSIETQATFTKTLTIPDYLKPGEYVAAIKIVSGESIGTSSQIFSISAESKTKTGSSIIIYPILAIIVAAAFLLVYKNKRELLHVKKLERRKIRVEKLKILTHKKDKYKKQLRMLKKALELKTINRKSYETAKRKISAEIKKLNDIIKRREPKIFKKQSL